MLVSASLLLPCRSFHLLLNAQVTLSALLLTTAIASVFVTVNTFQFHFGIVQVEDGPLPKVQVCFTLPLIGNDPEDIHMFRLIRRVREASLCSSYINSRRGYSSRTQLILLRTYVVLRGTCVFSPHLPPLPVLDVLVTGICGYPRTPPSFRVANINPTPTLTVRQCSLSSPAQSRTSRLQGSAGYSLIPLS